MQTTFMYTLCVNHLSKKQCSQPRRECWKEFSLTPLFKLISIFYLIVKLYDILHIESLRADGILFFFFPITTSTTCFEIFVGKIRVSLRVVFWVELTRYQFWMNRNMRLIFLRDKENLINCKGERLREQYRKPFRYKPTSILSPLKRNI